MTTDALTQARQDVADAQALVDALEERIREGDQAVTADELAARRDLVRFAELRVDAAQRQADALDANQRHEQYEAVAGEARAVHAIGLGRLAAAHAEAVAANIRLYQVAAEVQADTLAVRQHARDALSLAEAHGETAALRETGLIDPAGHRFGRHVAATTETGEVRLTAVYPAKVVAAATGAALDAVCRPGEHDLTAEHTALVAVAAEVDRDLPGVLPDGWRKTR